MELVRISGMERSQSMIVSASPGKGATIEKTIFVATEMGTLAIMTNGTCVLEIEKPVIMVTATENIPDKESLINNQCLV